MKTRDSIKREAIFAYRGSKDGIPIHIPNKVESKELRKLMAQTGLSEKELRQHKKYRKQLADAAKTANERKTTPSMKLMKVITQNLKLPKEHPHVLFVHKSILYGKKSHSFYLDVKYFLEGDVYKKYLETCKLPQ